MNKHGQTLILFVILIPIILMLLAIIVDAGVVISKKAHIKEVTKTVMKNNYSKSDEVIKQVIEKNEIETKNLEIVRNNGLEIKNEVKVKSIFGSIIGLKEYTIRINIKGTILNDKMVFE